ncbi:MAG: methyl-accepting chemotaxis protein [Lachnospiraceae bacterium]|nr:methyl-accepting chemotaxis protein [Lachnospiraceae bacterium]
MKKWFNKMKMSQKLSWVMCLMLLVSIVGANTSYYSVIKNNVKESVESELMGKAVNGSETFNAWLEKQAIIVENIANTMAYEKQKDPVVVAGFLMSNLKNNDAALMYYVGIEKWQSTIWGSTEQIELNPLNESWYKEAKAQNKTVYSAPHVDKNTGKMVITVSTPLLVDDVFVVFAADINIESVVKIIDTYNSDVMSAFLITSDTTVVVHNNPELAPQVVNGTEKLTKLNSLTDIKVIPRGMLDYKNVEGKNMKVAMSKVGLTDLYLCLEYSSNYANTKAQHASRQATFVSWAEILAALVITYFIVKKMIKPLDVVVKQINKLSEYDFSTRVEEKYTERGDEIGLICTTINGTMDVLSDLLKGVIDESMELYSTSENLSSLANETETALNQVSNAVEDIARGATSQAGDTTKAQEYVIQMGEKIEATVDNIADFEEQSGKMSSASQEAGKILAELMDITKKAIDAIDELYQQTVVTNESAMKISAATSLITDIADETNLLSLNASIEAARAGDAGRGFAVVADQISKLANQSNASAVEIENITQTLISESSKSVDVMKEFRDIMATQSEKVEKTSNAFRDVDAGIDASSQNIMVIGSGAQELDKIRVEIVDLIESLSAIAQENAAGTEETSAATFKVETSVADVAASSSKLLEISKELEDKVSRFKLS